LEPDHAPEPPAGRKVRREHPFLAFMHNVMTLMFVGVIGLTALFYFVRMQFDQPGPLGYATVVVIPRGEGMSAIADRLEREGVIADRRIFVASALYFRAQDKLKAGEYAIKKNASIREVLDTLVEGKAILYSVSLPEGLTSMQIIDRLNNNPELTGSTAVIPPEGSLLPDTYRFARGTRRDELVARMQDEQTKFIDKDVTQTHVLWKHQTKYTDHIVSPLVSEGRILLVKEGGITTVFDQQDGTPLRGAKRVGSGGSYFASPVAGDGKIYLASENGKVVVLKNDAGYEELATNDLGESVIATPALADGRIYVRTRTQLLCFGGGAPSRELLDSQAKLILGRVPNADYLDTIRPNRELVNGHAQRHLRPGNAAHVVRTVLCKIGEGVNGKRLSRRVIPRQNWHFHRTCVAVSMASCCKHSINPRVSYEIR
jgi:hypothetical protein